jgi:hypothetical protein
MKTIALAVTVATLVLAGGLRAGTDDQPVTIKGEIKCAKCLLKDAEAKECRNVLETEVDHKKVTYVLTDSDATKEFQGKTCHDGKKVKVTGTVTAVDGKKQLKATKIEKEAVS